MLTIRRLTSFAGGDSLVGVLQARGSEAAATPAGLGDRRRLLLPERQPAADGLSALLSLRLATAAAASAAAPPSAEGRAHDTAVRDGGADSAAAVCGISDGVPVPVRGGGPPDLSAAVEGQRRCLFCGRNNEGDSAADREGQER